MSNLDMTCSLHQQPRTKAERTSSLRRGRSAKMSSQAVTHMRLALVSNNSSLRSTACSATLTLHITSYSGRVEMVNCATPGQPSRLLLPLPMVHGRRDIRQHGRLLHVRRERLAAQTPPSPTPQEGSTCFKAPNSPCTLTLEQETRLAFRTLGIPS